MERTPRARRRSGPGSASGAASPPASAESAERPYRPRRPTSDPGRRCPRFVTPRWRPAPTEVDMTAPIAIVPRREVDTVMPGLDLYWIPLGAGTRVVQVSGKTYEALCARLQRRRPCPLYHSALVATTGEGRFTIEMTPIPGPRGPQERGVVAEGAVGLRWAGSSSSCPTCPPRCGAATSCTPAICGTRTRSSPGCSSRPGWTAPPATRPAGGGRRGGTRAWSRRAGAGANPRPRPPWGHHRQPLDGADELGGVPAPHGPAPE